MAIARGTRMPSDCRKPRMIEENDSTCCKRASLPAVLTRRTWGQESRSCACTCGIAAASRTSICLGDAHFPALPQQIFLPLPPLGVRRYGGSFSRGLQCSIIIGDDRQTIDWGPCTRDPSPSVDRHFQKKSKKISIESRTKFSNMFNQVFRLHRHGKAPEKASARGVPDRRAE